MTKSSPPTRDALPAGYRLMDYDIESLLGVGGFGLVYRAREAALQRAVAIKEYLPSSLAQRGDGATVILRSPQHDDPFDLGLKSFVNEARLLARFDHPSLVKVYRFWEAHGTAYMVMPCYEGPTLYDARRAMDGPPDEAWLRALMEPLLGALDCLHREQVFHRDVAPDNILVVADPDAPCGIRPVLLDFGAARRVINQNTQALTEILKPSFAPIEQYAETTQLRQGPWTDLYGLAAVLHYCITGRTPVPATARAVYDDLPSLLQMAPALAQDFGREYSPALLATIDRALSVKPDERPASATAWRELLARDAEPAARVPVQEPGAGDPVLPTEPERDVWNERTIMVTPVAGREAAAQESYTTTHSLAAEHRVVEPLAATAPSHPWPRGLLWAAGAVALSVVVALSSWSVNRQQRAGDSWQVATATPAQAPVDPFALTMGPDAAAAPSAPQASEGLALRPAPAPAAAEELVPDSGETRRALRAAAPEGRAETGVKGVEGIDQPGDVRADAPAPKAATVAVRQGSAATSERDPQHSRVPRPSTAGQEPLNPRLACGDRNFIAMAICMKRYCGRAPYARHSECARMRQQEEAQQRQFP